MFGRKSELSELEVRKQLLVAESELQRTGIREDWCALENEFHTWAAQGKSAFSALSTTALTAAGLSILAGALRKGSGSSWLSRVLSVAKVAATLWFTMRNRSHSDSD